MGFWDVFKKKKQEAEVKKVQFTEISSWIKNERADTEKKEKQFLDEVKTNLTQLIKELEGESATLENFDMDSKKAEQRIKFIVMENLSYYLEHLKKLISKLKELDENVNIEKINSAFDYFEKKSSLNFQKATILIGKEMGDVRDSIRKFLKNLNKTLEENNAVIEKSKKLSLINDKLNKISENQRRKEEIAKAMENYDFQINKLNEEINSNQKKIENIKSSSEFLEIRNKQQEIEKIRQELDNLLSQLKSSINFKALANFYHSFEKEMAIVKSHRDNFKQAFEKNNQALLSLLQESKLTNSDIESKIKEITDKQEQINNTKIDDIGINAIKKEIKKTTLKINEIEAKKIVEEKRKNKLKDEISQTESHVKGELIKINIEVI